VLDDDDFAIVNKLPGQVVHPGRASATVLSLPDCSPSIPRCRH